MPAPKRSATGKAQQKAWTAKYRRANPDKVKRWKAAHYKRHRGRIRTNQRDYYMVMKDEILAAAKRRYAAGGKRLQRERKRLGLPHPTRPEPERCECCGGPPGKKALALDHCHTTNRFRGWLCSKCNAAIGALGDTAETVMRAVRYLLAFERGTP